MRLNGADITSMAVENLECKPEVAMQLFELLSRQKMSGEGLKELKLVNLEGCSLIRELCGQLESLTIS